jgi:hypothetical protein
MANDWRVSAARHLEVDDDPNWTAEAARSRVFEWAADAKGRIDGRLCRQAFLAYDAAMPDLKGAYRIPFCDIVHGELKAFRVGLRHAAEALEKAELPRDVQRRARGVVDEYFASLRTRDSEPKQPLTKEELARILYRQGLQEAVFLRQRTEVGPIVTCIPVGVLAHKAFAEYETKLPKGEQPSVEELWDVASLAIDMALRLDPDSFKTYGEELFAVGFKSVWPEVEKKVLWDFQHGEAGQLTRGWISQEAERQAEERLWGVREVARREGLRNARAVLRDLARALTLDSAADRAMVLTRHHRDLQDVLTS